MRAALALCSLLALPAVAQAPRMSVYDVAHAYYRYGYLRGQIDALEGVTVVGHADRYKLPPVDPALRQQVRAARAAAINTLGSAK